ncbi:aminotransferase [Vibrio sp. qd031]|uniref:Der GTPase-activating protein YihI n=1 Tax=Vibrio sp. qd031 TaxID=1603038 RepID=UPI000A103F28|nr:Der GTPase-activating protein YihI [Vibrio sp. qd031]ORT51686.1 aminotransferase [Vibrio sp. qd031]
MSRNKKSRKPGAGGEVDVIVVRNRTESDVEGRLRKKAKKRKGLKTGSRHSDGSDHATHGNGIARDPRLGSKKKIPLVVEAKKKPSKTEKKRSAKQELELLENDAQLLVLLDRLDNGESLGAGLQQYVDQKLSRIEVLMNQLGLLDDNDFEEDIEQPEAPQPQKTKTKAKSKTDDALLNEFENLDWDEFKE